MELPLSVGAPLAKLPIGRYRKLRMKGWDEGGHKKKGKGKGCDPGGEDMGRVAHCGWKGAAGPEERREKKKEGKKRARPKKNFQIIFSHILAILEIQNFHSKLNIKSGMNAIIHLWP